MTTNTIGINKACMKCKPRRLGATSSISYMSTKSINNDETNKQKFPIHVFHPLEPQKRCEHGMDELPH